MIVLGRHGPPDCPRPSFASSADFGLWMKAYDAAEVVPGALPAAGHVALMQALPKVFTSGVPRSDSSARLLGLDASVMGDGLLHEAPLPTPPVPLLRMPIDAWWTLSRVLWLSGFAPDCEHRSETWRRVRIAADELVALAERHGSVGVLAHGWTNHWIGFALRRRGWSKKERSGYGPWSRLIFVK
jgi:hypothetical protein